MHDWHGDEKTICPPVYWDIAIGSGACGLGCRGCYLLGTFQGMRDPHQPLLYENAAFFWNAVRRWLISPRRRACHTLGTFRETRASLDYWRRHWNLPAMEWRPETLQRDGTHRHTPVAYRVMTYEAIAALCAEFFSSTVVSLCEETTELRRLSKLTSGSCDCVR